MPFIITTLAAGVEYTNYRKTPSGKYVAEESVTVKGGSGVADKRTLVTPLGVVTRVTAAQIKILKANPLFKDHLEKGFVTIVDKDPRDADAAATAMPRDESAQLTPEDYTVAGKKTPETGAAVS